MLERYKAINRKKHSTTFTPKKATSLEDEQKQLSVVEQFKKIQQEQHQTLMEKLKQRYPQ